MHHFFVTPQQISGDKIRIEGGDVNHMKNVLRMKLHEKAEISDGESRTYLCEVEAYEEDVAVLHILEEMEADTEPASKLYLFQGLPKSDKMELIVQKAVELGVYQVIPVAMKRCVVKLDEKKSGQQNKALAGNCGSSRQAEQTGCDPDGGTCNELCTGSENGIRNGSEAGALRTGRGDGTDETADRTR